MKHTAAEIFVLLYFDSVANFMLCWRC